MFKKIFGLIIISLLIGSWGCEKNINNGVEDEKAGFSNITVSKAGELIEENRGDENFSILDVRTPREYSEGHIEGAKLINYYDTDFKEQLQKLDRKKTYLIYCRTGNRSRKALNIMKELKFEKVYNMTGGIVKWKEEGYRTVK